MVPPALAFGAAINMTWVFALCILLNDCCYEKWNIKNGKKENVQNEDHLVGDRTTVE